MRILYLHQHFTTPEGAGKIRSYEFARRLVARGHEVVMVCGSYNGGDTGLKGAFHKGRRQGMVDGIEVIELDMPYSNADNFLKRSRTFLRYAIKTTVIALTTRYDLVFATTTPLTVALPGILARWLRGRTFVFEVRDLWPELPRAMGVITNRFVLWALSCLEWAAYRSAHALVGLSPGIVEGIMRRGVPGTRIALIPNGCDFGIFSEPVDPWRPEGVDPHQLMAIYMGTHGMANGLDAVLNAAEELQQRGQNDIRIVLIGQGKCKPALQTRAQQLGLRNVLFLPLVTKRQLVGLAASADIGLQILSNIPAFYTGTSPNKFFDYLAASLPVLTNYPGWVAGLIHEHACGYAVPPDDPAAFADALQEAWRERAQLPQMGMRARQLGETEFHRDKLSLRFAEWIENVAMRKTLGHTIVTSPTELV